MICMFYLLTLKQPKTEIMRKSIIKTSLFFVLFAFVFNACNKEEKPHTEENHSKVKWNQEDHEGVKAAISDYVEGLYQVDSTRIMRSVDTTLRKLGYWYNAKEKAFANNLPMSHAQLVSLAARWNKDGSNASETSPKDIEIYDINSKTASAKLTAEWGIDYFHLGKVNGKWKIYNVIWQSMPE